MEKYLKVTIGLFIKWAKEKGVKDSFVNYKYWKDKIYLKQRELKKYKKFIKNIKILVSNSNSKHSI